MIVRQGLLDRAMQRDSDFHKAIIVTLLEAQSYQIENFGTSQISREVVISISKYLATKYRSREGQVYMALKSGSTKAEMLDTKPYKTTVPHTFLTGPEIRKLQLSFKDFYPDF